MWAAEAAAYIPGSSILNGSRKSTPHIQQPHIRIRTTYNHKHHNTNPQSELTDTSIQTHQTQNTYSTIVTNTITYSSESDKTFFLNVDRRTTESETNENFFYPVLLFT